MLRMLISPKTTPSASVAKTVEPSSETTVSLPRLMMYSSLPMSPSVRPSVHHVQSVAVADVALAADVVARTEDGQLQLEHELDEQPRLALLEDGDPSQRLKVNLCTRAD